VPAIAADGPRDVVASLVAGTDDLLTELLPLRWSRMGESPFAFYRGTAGLMAADLARSPHSGVITQLCGDAHIGNFGLFATAERNLVFDVNDFDETLPGPFEWDVKRLACSVVLAGRDRGLDLADTTRAVRRTVRTYRRQMKEYARSGYLHVWYDRIDGESALAHIRSASDAERRKALAKARSRNSVRLLARMAEETPDGYRIRDAPPLIVPLRDAATRRAVEELLHTYVDNVPTEFRSLLHHYDVVDVALKVVGVGSVGTRCFVAMCFGRGTDDPLFLQVKESVPSALEPHLGSSEHAHPGERTVRGQRIMQAAGDPFLGWASVGDRAYFIRQLHDMKLSMDLATLTAPVLADYSQLCARALARGHARAGDARLISDEMRPGKEFDASIGAWAVAYADQVEIDFAQFRAALEAGSLITPA
jgi:uncharacterized protein (DUF2252 family)